jgi:hypothetical protein
MKKNLPFYKSNNFIIGSVFLAFSVYTLLEIQKIKNPEGRYIPIFAAILICLASISLISKTLIQTSENTSSKLFYNSKEIIMIASLLLFFFSMSTIGFYTTSFLYLIPMYLYVKKDLSKRSVMQSVIFSSILVIILYAGLGLSLRIIFPSGILF